MKKIKIGLIGAGNIANTHLTSYAKLDDVEIYAICDINPERLKKTADKFGIERRYASADEMLAACASELDAADVCVWNCYHAECSIKALNAGLNVLCEKPMAYNAEEAVLMKKAAERNGKLLMIGFVRRFSNDTKIAKDFIEKDYLGDIYYTRAQYIRRHGNPGGWFADKERSGGGPVIDLGVHVLDLARYLMNGVKPVSVYATVQSKLGKRDNLKTGVAWQPEDANGSADICTVEDFASALVRYENGAVTLLETSFEINGEDEAKQQLYGTKGGMSMSGMDIKLHTTCNDFLADVNLVTDDYKDAFSSSFDVEIAHFVDCVKNGTPCRATADDGILMMKVLDAIYESGRTGHEVIIKQHTCL